ncbi:MAG TPA: hypothetical protein GX521_01380, partial [Firmicutes bacterium]|nr:hypothetical protein [Bacillota bacterium]
ISRPKNTKSSPLGRPKVKGPNLELIPHSITIDLERVTRIARKMVMEWGMSSKLGPLTFGRPSGEDLVFLGRDISRERNYSEEIAAAIDQEVRRLVDTSYEQALETLNENREKLDEVAQALLERETLTQEQFEAIMEGRPVEWPKEDEVTKQAASAYKEQEEVEKVRTEHRRRSSQEPVVGEA